MNEVNPDPLLRIAHALERLAPAMERLTPARPPEADPAADAHFRWDGARLQAVSAAAPLPLDRYVGVDGQLAALTLNLGALRKGRPAHDMLLWGARGMGKSALIRSLAARHELALVQAAGDALGTLPALFDRVAGVPRPFLVFVDDLAFAASDPGVRLLRSLLDGGIAERPANVRLAVTSNHRHLVETVAPDSRHARDAADDQLALVDRFGLVLGFHVPDQPTYLEMVRRHLAAEGLRMGEPGITPEDAIAFALARGGRSGRTAWHYRTEMLTRRADG